MYYADASLFYPIMISLLTVANRHACRCEKQGRRRHGQRQHIIWHIFCGSNAQGCAEVNASRGPRHQRRKACRPIMDSSRQHAFVNSEFIKAAPHSV